MGDLEKFAKTIHSAATVFAVGDRVKGGGPLPERNRHNC